MTAAATALHPLAWRSWATSARSTASAPFALPGAIIQRWSGSARHMDQPPLDHHYIVLHLGGAKRVTRNGARQQLVREIADRAFTTVEAGNAYRWSTEGPIAFAHLYVEPARFARTVAENTGRDPARVQFHECFGERDPLLSSLAHAMVLGSEGDDLALMEREAQLDAVLLRLYERSSQIAEDERPLMIPPAGIQRVRDFVTANLRNVITLDELAALTGYSRFHFARGFRAATGLPPYAYITRERIALACRLLEAGELPVHAVAAAAGFTSHPLFASRFRQVTGLSPSAYRRVARR
jgi:AraC family transcriptional regulator